MLKFRAGPRPLRPTYDEHERRPYRRIAPAPLSPTVGAEIDGVSLSDPMDEETFDEVHRALLEYKVIFFRDQEITPEQHVAFARRFGALETHPFVPHREGHPEVMVLEKNEQVGGYENVWHSDVTWRLDPSLGSVLLARKVPAVGGDTLFCDMYAAYEGLGERDAHVARRSARRPRLHPHVRPHDERRGAGEEAAGVSAGRAPGRPHASGDRPQGRCTSTPRSLRTSSAWTRPTAIGCSSCCTGRPTVPEYQCRFRWRPYSIAFWDNRAVQHYAASDYFPQPAPHGARDDRRRQAVLAHGTPYLHRTFEPVGVRAHSGAGSGPSKSRSPHSPNGGWSATEAVRGRSLAVTAYELALPLTVYLIRPGPHEEGPGPGRAGPVERFGERHPRGYAEKTPHQGGGHLHRRIAGEALPEAHHLIRGFAGGDEGGVDRARRGAGHDHSAPLEARVLPQALVDADLERPAGAAAGQDEPEPRVIRSHRRCFADFAGDRKPTRRACDNPGTVVAGDTPCF